MVTMSVTKRLALVFTVLGLLVLSPAQFSEGFSLEKMCEVRCSYGRGGHLCNCGAVHFAGKRAGERYGGHSLLNLHEEDLMSSERNDMTERQHMLDSSPQILPKNEDSAGKDSPFRSGGLGHDASRGNSHYNNDNSGNGDVLVEGFIGVEDSQRSAVHRLALLLKDAIDERFSDNSPKARRWQSGVPFEENGVLF